MGLLPSSALRSEIKTIKTSNKVGPSAPLNWVCSELKSTSSHLAPGSQVLLKDITNPDLPDSERIDVKKPIRDLTIADWGILVRAFDKWPFAPEVRSYCCNSRSWH
jgi:hypothetical protein